MKTKSLSAAHAASRLLAISLLTGALACGGALCGCSASSTDGNTASVAANSNENAANNANTNTAANNSTTNSSTATEANGPVTVNGDTTTTGSDSSEAVTVFDNTCSIKGNVIGAQHIRSVSKDNFMLSVLIEPDLPDALQSQAEQSQWQIGLYIVVKDASGNYLGSWAPDTITYTWTFGNRIEDSAKHNPSGKPTECPLDTGKYVEVYLTWAKGTFPDGSTIEYKNKENADLPSTQEGADRAASEDQLFGSVSIDQMAM